MKSKEIIRLIQQDGWYEVRQNGSHRHFKHPTKIGITTVANSNKDLPPKTLKSIEKQSGVLLRK